ncbi:MAG: SDR family NAD(P)-dependent oxidoreductase [Cyclobacteriaceae bacterium]
MKICRAKSELLINRPSDTCDMADIGKLADICIGSWNTFHHIDYVFLNAGFAVRDLIIDTDLELIKKVLSVNFVSSVAITKALLPMMKKRGSGCFAITSSLSGKYGIPRLAAYSASKHALHGFDLDGLESKVN